MSDDSATLEFAAVFESEFAYVWSSLRRLGVHAGDLDDVTHDVFLQLYRKWQAFDPARPVKPWIYAFVARTAADYRRLARHRREHLDDDAVAEARSEDSAEDILSREDDASLVARALERVDPERRAILIAYEFDDRAMKDIAEAHGIPLNTAYSRLRVAREEFATYVRKNTLVEARSLSAERSRAHARLMAALPLPAPLPALQGGGGAILGAGAVKLAVAVTVGAAMGAGGGYTVAKKTVPPEVRVVYVDRPSIATATSTASAAPTSSAEPPAPLSASVAAPPVPKSVAPPSSMQTERVLLDEARTAFARGDLSGCADALDTHKKRFENGVLAEEREALAIRTLVAQSRIQEASARAARFRTKYPRSLMLPAVEASLDAGSPRPIPTP